MQGCIKGLHILSIQFVGIATQANTELKNWLESYKQEVPNSCVSQQCLKILLECPRESISDEAAVWTLRKVPISNLLLETGQTKYTRLTLSTKHNSTEIKVKVGGARPQEGGEAGSRVAIQ